MLDPGRQEEQGTVWEAVTSSPLLPRLVNGHPQPELESGESDPGD